MRLILVILLTIIFINAVYKNLSKENGSELNSPKKIEISTEKEQQKELNLEDLSKQIQSENEISLSPNAISNAIPETKIIAKNIEKDNSKKDKKISDLEKKKFEQAISRIQDEWKVSENNKKIMLKYDLISEIPIKPKFEIVIPKQENLFQDDKLLSATENKKIAKEPFKLAVISDVADKAVEGLSYLTQPIIKPIQAISQPTNYVGSKPVEKISFKPASLNTANRNDEKSSPLFFSKPPKSVSNYNGRRYVNNIIARTNNPKKKNFIKNVGVATAEINQKILNERNALLYVFKRFEAGFPLTDNEKKWVSNLAIKYKVQNFNISSKAKRDELISKINIVPEALAIAQGALESGWGSSNIAKNGYNFFGMKCSDDCKNNNNLRKSKKSYASFKNPQDAVESYIHNLNTNSAYKNFRIARENLGSNVKASLLSNYLDGYAKDKQKYQMQLTQIINYNKLEN